MSDDYVTIIAVHRQGREPGRLLFRAHKKLLLPSKIALVVAAILMLLLNVVSKYEAVIDLNIYYFLMGVMAGMAMPLLVFSIIEKPILLIVFIYGLAL